MRERIKEIFNRESIEVVGEKGEALGKANIDAKDTIEHMPPAVSPQLPLWNEQMKTLKLPNGKQMRWPPSLHSKSAAA